MVSNGQAGGLLHLHVRRAGDAARAPSRSASPISCNTVHVVAEDFHGHVAAHAGDEFVEAHLDRLGELVVVAGQFLDGGFHLADEFGLGLFRDSGHSVRGFSMTKPSATLGGIGSVAISAVPILAKTSFTSGNSLSALFERVLHLDGLRQARAGNAQRVQGDVAFVEARE